MATADAKPGASRPRVSVGLPVRNGEPYLIEALDSVAAQTFTDYELIICDNASDDRTREICEERAARDPRIRYHRNTTNVGGDRNYYRCFQLSSAEFFVGFAHDDRFHPEYLEKVLPVLESDPSIVFCHSRAYVIDAAGAVIRAYDARPFTTSPHAPERFRDAIAPRPVVVHLGVIRTSTLRQMPPLLAYPASDVYWQAELALRGRLVEIPDLLFYRRIRPDSGGAVPARQRIEWSNPAKAHKVIYPSWRRPIEYARSVMRTPLTLSQRIECFGHIRDYIRRRGGTAPLIRDVRAAARTHLDRFAFGHRILESRDRSRKS